MRAKKKIVTIYYILFTIIWVIVMYNDDPNNTTDLYRHYERFDFIGSYFKNLYDLSSYYMSIQGDFIFYYLIYFIKKSNLSKNMLPVIIIIIYYGINYVLFIKSYKKTDIRNKRKSFLLVILTLGLIFPYLMFSTLRYPLAVSFLGLGTYKLFEENKKTGYIFLIMALFTHSGILLIVVISITIRLFYYRYQKLLSNNKILILLFILTCLVSLNLNIIIALFTKIGMTGVANKIEDYSLTSNVGVGLSQQIAIGLVFFNYSSLIFQKSVEKIEILMKVIVLLILISFPIYKILFIRYTWILVFLSSPYFFKKRITMKKIGLLIITNIVSILIYRNYIMAILF